MASYVVSGAQPVSPPIALDRVVEMAREITGARYGALGILNEQRTGLDQFLTSGMDAAARRAIGHPPRGRGVLGTLILDAQPLRVADVGAHPESYGFPAGHPVMRSFLGVPVVIGGQVQGNLYVAEKADGEFTEADEDATVILAESAANTIAFERRSHERYAETVPGSSSVPVEMACERLHPVRCAEVLLATSVGGLLAVAMEHGACVHGFTPAWYSREKRNAMTAAVMHHLGAGTGPPGACHLSLKRLPGT